MALLAVSYLVLISAKLLSFRGSNMSNLFKSCALTTLLFFPLTASWAEISEEQAEAAIKTRQGLLKVVGYYFGPLVGMARGQLEFDGELASSNAEKISQLVQMIPDVFKLDTRENGISSGALDSVWTNTNDFAQKATISSEAAMALSKAASEGKSSFLQALGAAGSSCKGCHEEYRKPQ